MWLAWESARGTWVEIDESFVEDCQQLQIPVREVDSIPIELMVTFPEYLDPTYRMKEIERESNRMFLQLDRFLAVS